MEVICPHCGYYIIIEKLNCGIFRHGVYKSGEQIDPHMKEKQCLQLVKDNKIYGCGKPFRIKEGNIEICEYI